MRDKKCEMRDKKCEMRDKKCEMLQAYVQQQFLPHACIPLIQHFQGVVGKAVTYNPFYIVALMKMDISHQKFGTKTQIG